MQLRAHTKAEIQSLDGTGTVSHLTMPFEANIRRVIIEIERKNLIEHVLETKPYVNIQFKPR